MIINPVLKEKDESQKRLNEKANNDLHTYFKNSHCNVSVMAKKYELHLKYTERKGGYLTPMKDELLSNVL